MATTMRWVLAGAALAPLTPLVAHAIVSLLSSFEITITSPIATFAATPVPVLPDDGTVPPAVAWLASWADFPPGDLSFTATAGATTNAATAVPWRSVAAAVCLLVVAAGLVAAAAIVPIPQALPPAGLKRDATPLSRNVASRRWIVECLLALGAVVLTAVAAAAATAGAAGWLAAAGMHAAPLAVGVRALVGAALRVVTAAAALHAFFAARVAGDYVGLPLEALPRTARPELRRPRYVAYMMALRTKMAAQRWWWVVGAVAAGAPLVAPAAAGLAQMGAAGINAAVAAFAADGLVTAVLAGADAALAVVMTGAFAVLAAPPANLLAAVDALAGCLLPLALGVLGAHSVCAWRTRDFSPKPDRRQLAWVWAPGSYGEHPGQTLPSRMPVRALGGSALPPSLGGTSDGPVTPPVGRRSIGGGTPSRRAGSVGRGGVAAGLASPLARLLSPDPGVAASARAALMEGAGEGAVSGTGLRGRLHRSPTAAADVVDVSLSVPRKYPDSTHLVAPGPLRIVLLTIGTRGDVQPFLALGAALKEAGHSIVIGTTLDFKDAVESAGLEFGSAAAPRVEQPAGWLTSKTVADMIRASGPSIAANYGNVATALYGLCTGPRRADVVIGTAMTVTHALSIAEALDIPVWLTKLAPDLLTAGWTNPGSSVSEVGWVNEAKCYKYWLDVAEAVKDVGLNVAEDVWRRDTLHIGPVNKWQRIDEMWYTPQLLGFSRHLFPIPTDYPPWAFQCGFWQVSDGEGYASRVDPALRAFLKEHEAKSLPVAVTTFGSMTLAARRSLSADIVRELRAAGYAVLVLTGWSTPAEGLPANGSDPHVLCVKEVLHSWLFPRVALVVHHGGAGTTASVLTARKPSIIIPVLRFADQPQWGALVHEKQVGVHVVEENPSRQSIRAAIKRVQAGDFAHAPASGSIITDRADALGALVRAELSTETAVALLESCLCNLVLPPADADAIHPQAGPLPPAASLSKAQLMCVRNCIPCRRLRTQLAAYDVSTSLSRLSAAMNTATVSHAAPAPAPAPVSVAPPPALPTPPSLPAYDERELLASAYSTVVPLLASPSPSTHFSAAMGSTPKALFGSDDAADPAAPVPSPAAAGDASRPRVRRRAASPPPPPATAPVPVPSRATGRRAAQVAAPPPAAPAPRVAPPAVGGAGESSRRTTRSQACK